MTSFPETECFEVLWKVKHVTFCCEWIDSPGFNFLGNDHVIRLKNPKSGDLVCELFPYEENPILDRKPMQISILTCDGSPDETRRSEGKIAISVPKNDIFGSRRNSFLSEDTLTVRLRILTPSGRGKCYFYSQIGVKSKYFLWTLPNFSNNEQNTTNYHERSMGIDRKIEYSGTLFCLKPINTSQYFSIEISRVGSRNCYCKLNIAALDINGKEVNWVAEEFAFEGQIMKFPYNMNKKKVKAFKTLLLPNDTLTLRCYFAVSEGKVTDETTITNSFKDVHSGGSLCGDGSSVTKEAGDILKIFEEKSNSDLQLNLKSLLDNGTLSDVSLQIGTEVIQAHKSILIARSSVFRAMFSDGMRETFDNTVVIEDLDVDTVLKFLLYVYTDTIHDYPWETLKRLYFAADKYDVSSLKMKCASRMLSNLSVSNVCELLVFANLRHDLGLKNAALEYISENDDIILPTEAWKEFEKSNSELACQVLRGVCSNKRIKLS